MQPEESASALYKARKRKFAGQKNPPSEIYILGERNSGTSYAASILRNAFNPPAPLDNTRQHEAFSIEMPVLKFKHMFRHSLLDETELRELSSYPNTNIVWILAVRSPCDWAEAMKRMPWHMCEPNHIDSKCPGAGMIGKGHHEVLKTYSLADFFEMEWGDWPESSNFRNLSFVSEDFVYRNVFQLRRHKLLVMKQIIDAVPRNVKIVRLHELERSPETFIQNLILEFGLKRKPDYHRQRPSKRIHTERCLSDREWNIAQREIDWQVESYFGFTFLDCHLCYDGS